MIVSAGEAAPALSLGVTLVDFVHVWTINHNILGLEYVIWIPSSMLMHVFLVRQLSGPLLYFIVIKLAICTSYTAKSELKLRCAHLSLVCFWVLNYDGHRSLISSILWLSCKLESFSHGNERL